MDYAIEDPFDRAVTIAVHETHQQNIGNNLPTYIMCVQYCIQLIVIIGI